MCNNARTQSKLPVRPNLAACAANHES